MYEVVLYATLAVIVCVVLYSVLGRQIGRGPDEDTKPEDIFGTTRDMDADAKRPRPSAPDATVAAMPVAAATTTNVTATGEPENAGVSRIRTLDPTFSPRTFLDQATTAYSMVLEAFASGDRDTLAMLLTPRMAGLYGEAIDDRERQDLTQVTDILRVENAKLVDARVDGSVGAIDVAFRAELSSALVDSVGQPVLGDPDMIANISEVWTFERDLRSDDPAWVLSDVAPESGDALPADPAPDTTS